MTIGILQPGYLPWLGFFEQINTSDLFIIYDDVQYDKNNWRNRNRIKTPQGAQWLTVPVLTKGKDKPLVKNILINNNEQWHKKHLRAIQHNYGKAPFFSEIYPVCQEILTKPWEYLIDLDMQFINTFSVYLGLKNDFVLSSSLGMAGGQCERLINICLHFEADTFYEGAAGQNYIQDDVFLRAGIKVSYQNYQHPTYHQLHGEFVSHLSIIDLLFNHGKDSLAILTGKKPINV